MKDMKCRECRNKLTLFLTGDLDNEKQREIEEHLSNCKECQAEYKSIKTVWELMGEIPQPEPSEALYARFNMMIHEYQESLNMRKYISSVGEWVNRLIENITFQVKPRLAFSIVLVVTGLLIGYILPKPQRTAIAYNRQIDSLVLQVSEVKQLMMLSLLQNPSASQRIRAVSYSYEIDNVDQKVINALLKTLDEDPNVNVRLVTLEALAEFSDLPEVRAGLVRSITIQDSPIMQSAIADVMVRLQEKSSVPLLQELLKKNNLNQMVKINIENSISKLI
jgi:hypothetical protein